MAAGAAASPASEVGGGCDKVADASWPSRAWRGSSALDITDILPRPGLFKSGLLVILAVVRLRTILMWWVWRDMPIVYCYVVVGFGGADDKIKVRAIIFHRTLQMIYDFYKAVRISTAYNL